MFVTLTDTAHFLLWHQHQQIKQKTKNWQTNKNLLFKANQDYTTFCRSNCRCCCCWWKVNKCKLLIVNRKKWLLNIWKIRKTWPRTFTWTKKVEKKKKKILFYAFNEMYLIFQNCHTKTTYFFLYAQEQCTSISFKI